MNTWNRWIGNKSHIQYIVPTGGFTLTGK